MFLPFQFKSLAQYELSDTKMEPYQEYVESCIPRYQMTHNVMQIRIPTNQLPVDDFTKEVNFTKGRFSKVVQVGDDLFPQGFPTI